MIMTIIFAIIVQQLKAKSILTQKPLYLSNFPVYVPLLHVGEPPRGDGQTRRHVNTDQTVVRNPQNLILLTAFEPEQTNTTV